ncbi:MAG: nicotinate-nucleotide adenylyltransferase [Armatimonadetes bacterium]|nr:nicotinate-nucleotide adenylyltransferase [Armatimonadota bacterium]MDW8026766.1 nicotinate-nucleotide adenylyltransferase [Armatimonadota bacterium]
MGVMGGTFDPIHYGHLLAAEEARFRFNLSRVIFVPCGTPPHKKPYKVTPAEHRYAMTVLATASNPYFVVSRIEIDRPGPSYAIDTVKIFRQQFGYGVEIFFITGLDAVLEILTWKNHDELIQLCQFIAVNRPGYDSEKLREHLPPSYLDRISLLSIPGIDISSTMIRERVRKNEPILYLTPETVCDYIAKHGLYK